MYIKSFAADVCFSLDKEKLLFEKIKSNSYLFVIYHNQKLIEVSNFYTSIMYN